LEVRDERTRETRRQVFTGIKVYVCSEVFVSNPNPNP
jgi:hypothetical protein